MKFQMYAVFILIVLWVGCPVFVFSQDLQGSRRPATEDRTGGTSSELDQIERHYLNRNRLLEGSSSSNPLHYRLRWDAEQIKRSRMHAAGGSDLVPLTGGIDPTKAFDSIDEMRSRIFSGFPLATLDGPPLEYTARISDHGVSVSMPLFGLAWFDRNSMLYASGNRIIQRNIVDNVPLDETIISYSPGWLIYSFALHPNFPKDNRIFLFCNGVRGKEPAYNRILSCRLEKRDGKWMPSLSAIKILEWESNGHDGGDLLFGQDGFLYIATGDGSKDADEYLSAQDFSDLRGAILRIDVTSSSESDPYRIPEDNPFLDLPQARPELYAKGLRNPWRMTKDALTGAIYIGNSGQDTTESIYLLQRGANYGWSVWEGGRLYQEKRPFGSGKLTFPLLDQGHDQNRSLTGGIVYRGRKFPELEGFYIWGDYETGRIWGARVNGNSFDLIKELASTGQNIFGFCESLDGGITILGPSIYQLEKNEEVQLDAFAMFPTRLSETALFNSVSDHELSVASEAFGIGAPSWNNGAEADRFFHIGENAKISVTKTGGWYVPVNSVFAQTLTLPANRTGIGRPMRIETRLLVSRGRDWSAYSYLWNKSQTDAVLVGQSGSIVDLEDHFGIVPTDGSRVWTIPSRSNCFGCHNSSQNTLLGFSSLQLRGSLRANEAVHQLDRWEKEGKWRFEKPSTAPINSGDGRLVDPYDDAFAIEERVRSYLHVNCSICHSGGGSGGNSKLNLRYDVAIESTGMLNSFPEHSDFGIRDARIVAPGSPERSLLLHRISSNDSGRMPPIGRSNVDAVAVKFMSEWIRQLGEVEIARTKWSIENLISSLDQLPKKTDEAEIENGKKVFRTAGCAQCHRIGKQGQGFGPNLTNIGNRKKPIEILQSILEPSEEIAPEYRSWLFRLSNGDVVEGIKVNESDRSIGVMVKDGNGKLMAIPKSDVQESSPSSISSMPGGLLSALSRKDILDLLGYLANASD